MFLIVLFGAIALQLIWFMRFIVSLPLYSRNENLHLAMENKFVFVFSA